LASIEIMGYVHTEGETHETNTEATQRQSQGIVHKAHEQSRHDDSNPEMEFLAQRKTAGCSTGPKVNPGRYAGGSHVC